MEELVVTYAGAPGGFALKMRLPPRTTAGKVVDGYCKQYAKKGHGALAPQALVLDCDGVHLPREAAVPAGEYKKTGPSGPLSRTYCSARSRHALHGPTIFTK